MPLLPVERCPVGQYEMGTEAVELLEWAFLTMQMLSPSEVMFVGQGVGEVVEVAVGRGPVRGKATERRSAMEELIRVAVDVVGVPPAL